MEIIEILFGIFEIIVGIIIVILVGKGLIKLTVRCYKNKCLGILFTIISLIFVGMFYMGYKIYYNYNPGIAGAFDPIDYDELANNYLKYMKGTFIFVILGIIWIVLEIIYKLKNRK